MGFLLNFKTSLNKTTYQSMKYRKKILMREHANKRITLLSIEHAITVYLSPLWFGINELINSSDKPFYHKPPQSNFRVIRILATRGQINQQQNARVGDSKSTKTLQRT